MFKLLTKGLVGIFDKISRSKAIDQNGFDSLLKDIRDALLSSDVALEIAEYFVQRIKQSCVKNNIFRAQKPLDMLLKLMKEELIDLISGGVKSDFLINLKGDLSIIMMIGTQGVGKTTTSAKIAYYLKSQIEGKKILLVSLDLKRPAAQRQLEILAASIPVDFFRRDLSSQEQICSSALLFAKEQGYSVVIFDTPGCSHTDQQMIKQLAYLKSCTAAREVLLVVDALIGQDSIRSVKFFADHVGISGVILSKMDSDSKGAAALSIKYLTNKLVKFIGIGEKIEDLEPFDAHSMSLRMLDMGDMESLKKKVANVTGEKSKDLELKKIQSGKFTLEDYEAHIIKMSKVGGFNKIVSFFPGASKFLDNPALANVDSLLSRQLSIIHSMTQKEKNMPQILTLSHKKRIAVGSGRTVEDVNILLRQFQQMANLIKSGPHSLAKFSKEIF